jgi:hypothetical protein
MKVAKSILALIAFVTLFMAVLTQARLGRLPPRGNYIFDEEESNDAVGYTLPNTPTSNSCYSGIGPGCLYNPYKENKYGDSSRVRTRYYAGQYYGRFDEDESNDAVGYTLPNTPTSNSCYSGIGPGCLYNPYKENKYGDSSRVRTRYYAGQYYGRFDEDESNDVVGGYSPGKNQEYWNRL